MFANIPKVSLEQWAAFKAVVDCGSFAAAAEQLQKSQSSISYAMAQLNDRLPTQVLQLKGRRAKLTAEGEVLYRYASQLIDQARSMEDMAAAMALEFEAEVNLALDVLLPVQAVCAALQQFSSSFPLSRVRILETSLSGTIEALVQKQASLAIGADVPVGFKGTPLMSVNMVPVAAPHHPIFALHQVSELELRSFRQVVVRDTGYRSQRDSGWLQAEQRWTVSHFSSSVSLIKSGLAFGFLPENWIAGELKEGNIQVIPLSDGYFRAVPLHLIHPPEEALGPATRQLSRILRTELKVN